MEFHDGGPCLALLSKDVASVNLYRHDPSYKHPGFYVLTLYGLDQRFFECVYQECVAVVDDFGDLVRVGRGRV